MYESVITMCYSSDDEWIANLCVYLLADERLQKGVQCQDTGRHYQMIETRTEFTVLCYKLHEIAPIQLQR